MPGCYSRISFRHAGEIDTMASQNIHQPRRRSTIPHTRILRPVENKNRKRTRQNARARPSILPHQRSPSKINGDLGDRALKVCINIFERFFGLILFDFRRYGVVEGRFCFEGGSRCAKGEGLHVLVTDQGEEITDALKLASQGLLAARRRPASRKSSSEYLFNPHESYETLLTFINHQNLICRYR